MAQRGLYNKSSFWLETAMPLEFFKLFFNADVTALLVTDTNRYAEQYIRRNIIAPHLSVKDWHPTDNNEMLAFLGLCVMMGIVYKPRLKMYWSSDVIYKTNIFSETMAPDGFLFSVAVAFSAFCRQQHLASHKPKLRSAGENSSNDKPDKGLLRCGIQPTARCVSELLVLFKRRLTFTQFISTKCAHFGIIIFQLCKASGILLDFLVYLGQMSQELLAFRDQQFTCVCLSLIHI